MLSFNKKSIVATKIFQFAVFDPCSDSSKYGSASLDVPNDVGVFFPDVWVGHTHGPAPAVKLGAL